MEVIAHDDAVESQLLGEHAVPEEIGGPELLRGRLPDECQHGSDILGGEQWRSPATSHDRSACLGARATSSRRRRPSGSTTSPRSSYCATRMGRSRSASVTTIIEGAFSAVR